MTAAALKYHGGKHYLAKKIVAQFPPHLHYVEPYFGGGSVLFEKDPEGVSEVVNDLNGALTNFWKVLQDTEAFEEFYELIEAVPFSEYEFDLTHDLSKLNPEELDVTCARALFVRCRQSLAGRMQHFTPLSRTRIRRGMNEQVSAWLTAIEGLSEVHKRLKRVVILNRDALAVIKQQDGPDTLTYADPPYLPSTRVSTEVYDNEMSEEEHKKLLETLCTIKGKFALSGYHSTLYDDTARQHGWKCTEFEIANSAAGGKKKRTMTECLYTNY